MGLKVDLTMLNANWPESSPAPPLWVRMSAFIFDLMNKIAQVPSPDELGVPGRAEADDLLLLVYDELRRLAAAQMAREKPGQTLDATGLVHEAYLKLAGTGSLRPRTNSFGPPLEPCDAS